MGVGEKNYPSCLNLQFDIHTVGSRYRRHLRGTSYFPLQRFLLVVGRGRGCNGWFKGPALQQGGLKASRRSFVAGKTRRVTV